MEAKDRIIVALDVNNLEEAVKLAQELGPHVGSFKVGLELLTSCGAPQVVKAIQEAGGKVGYDGKFCDIPNTVAGASKAVAAMNVSWFNVHASAGKKSVEAAVANRGNSDVYGVTVLTSIDADECVSIFGDAPGKKVLQFATMLAEVGTQGIICSPQEAEMLAAEPSLDGLKKITPGIRPQWAAAQDQKRIMTPTAAMRVGVDCMVIGRPITKPPDEIGSPVNAALLIASEIEEAFVEPR